MPPRTIVMATGPEGGAYNELGERYRSALARAGVEVRLVPTGGSLDNLALLLDPRSGVSVGLISGGATREGASSDLKSLGTMFYEPLWAFHRREFETRGSLVWWAARYRLGPKAAARGRCRSSCSSATGSIGWRAAWALTPQAAGEKLLAGEIDAALILNLLGLARGAAAHRR